MYAKAVSSWDVCVCVCGRGGGFGGEGASHLEGQVPPRSQRGEVQCQPSPAR